MKIETLSTSILTSLVLKLAQKSEEFVTLVFENIQQHGKSFNIRKPKELINITICLFLQNMTMISYLL